MVVYLAGPMSGIEDFNRPMFKDVANLLREQGYTVLNPIESDGELGEDPKWRDYLRKDLALVAASEAICVLPGWENSRGARLEVSIGFQLGYPIMIWDEDEQKPRHLMRREDRDDISG